MLTAWFEKLAANGGPVRRTTLMPGVTAYDCAGELPATTRLAGPSDGRCEVWFCRSGRLCLLLTDGRRVNIGAQDVAFVGAASRVRGFESVFERLAGCLISIDKNAARDSLRQLYTLLGGPLPDTAQLEAALKNNGGLVLVREKSWRTALFDALTALPEDRQAPYCAMKTAELLYLLASRRSEAALRPETGYFDRYQQNTLRQVHDYMLTHLDQKVTVQGMAERFQVSPTFLKTGFRQLYGEPVHRYLQRYRLEKAANLLQTTMLPVPEIAAAVGYASVSQFGTAFQAMHQTTPARYRRMLCAAAHNLPHTP